MLEEEDESAGQEYDQTRTSESEEEDRPLLSEAEMLEETAATWLKISTNQLSTAETTSEDLVMNVLDEKCIEMLPQDTETTTDVILNDGIGTWNCTLQRKTSTEKKKNLAILILAGQWSNYVAQRKLRANDK